MITRIMALTLLMISLNALSEEDSSSKQIKAEPCYKKVCLDVSDYGDAGWHEVKLVLGSSEPKFCFIRWENDVFFEKVTGESKSYYLQPQFNPLLLSYQCDSQDSCSHWMLKRNLCKSTSKV